MLAPESFPTPPVVLLGGSDTVAVLGFLQNGTVIAAGSNNAALLPALNSVAPGFRVFFQNTTSTDFTFVPQTGDNINGNTGNATIATNTVATLVASPDDKLGWAIL